MKSVRNFVVKNVLQTAWARFGNVKMKELDDKTMAFEFDTDRDREQILDLSPWSVQGHCLNLRLRDSGMRMEDVHFDILDIWLQLHGLSLGVCNEANARQIGSTVGRFLAAEPNHDAKNRDFLRIRVELNVEEPFPVGFTWPNEKGQEKWATFMYERLLDICFGCGRLGHTSQMCDEEIAMDPKNLGRPLFGPWMQGTRPMNHRWHRIGGGHTKEPPTREPNRQTWRDIMNASRDGARWDSSKGKSTTSADSTVRNIPSRGLSPPSSVSKHPTHAVAFLEPMDRDQPVPREKSLCLFDLNCSPPEQPPEGPNLLPSWVQPSLSLNPNQLTPTSASLPAIHTSLASPRGIQFQLFSGEPQFPETWCPSQHPSDPTINIGYTPSLHPIPETLLNHPAKLSTFPIVASTIDTLHPATPPTKLSTFHVSQPITETLDPAIPPALLSSS